jgi:presenilin-like A22 family membrane protease
MPETKLSLPTMWAIIIAVFCIVALGAIAIAPAFTSTPEEHGVGSLLQKPFDNPSDIGNSVQTFLIAMGGALAIGLLMGGFLRWILHKEIKVAVRVIVSCCVFLILCVTFAAITTAVLGTLGSYGIGVIFLALGITVVQYFYPEYWVIDAISILVAVGISALIGSSMGLVPAMILLCLFSTYDFIAVVCTNFMKNMAQGSSDLKLPSMFILPYDLGTSYIESTVDMCAGKKNFMILGTGDLVFPTVLAVSATQILHNFTITISIIIGILVAYSVMFVMLKCYPQKFKLLPGLPFLCGGAILGLVISSFILGISWL